MTTRRGRVVDLKDTRMLGRKGIKRKVRRELFDGKPARQASNTDSLSPDQKYEYLTRVYSTQELHFPSE